MADADNDPIQPPKSPLDAPKRITNLTHLGGMIRGLGRRLSGKNSRLSSPRPRGEFVTKRY